MAQKSKANLTSSLNIAITDALNRQNTAPKVRGILQDIIDSSANVVDGFSGGTGGGTFLGYSGTTSGLTISGNYEISDILPTKFRTTGNGYENSLFFYGDAAANLISQTSGLTQYAAFTVGNAIATISAQDYGSGNSTGIVTAPTGITINTNAAGYTIDANGITGLADYSSTYQNESYIQKMFADANYVPISISTLGGITSSINNIGSRILSTVNDSVNGNSSTYDIRSSRVTLGNTLANGFSNGFSMINGTLKLTSQDTPNGDTNELTMLPSNFNVFGQNSTGTYFIIDGQDTGDIYFEATGTADTVTISINDTYALVGSADYSSKYSLFSYVQKTYVDNAIGSIPVASNPIWSASTGLLSAVISGSSNIASGQNSLAGGVNSLAVGTNNFAWGSNNRVGIGTNNAAAGGSNNTITGSSTLNSLNSFIGGGSNITISGSARSNAVGTTTGLINSGTQNLLLGGNNLTISGGSAPINSVMIGGQGNVLNGSRSVMLGGSGMTGSLNDTVYVPNLFASNNVSGSSAFFTGSVNTNAVNSLTFSSSNGNIGNLNSTAITGGTLTASGLAGSGNRIVTVDNTGLLSAITTNTFVQRIYKDVVDSSGVTSTTAETISKSVFIPAGTFTTGDTIFLKAIASKSNTTGVFTIRFRVNTTNTLSGATNLGYYDTPGATSRYSACRRDIIIKGSQSQTYEASPSLSDELAATTDRSLLNINWSIDQYLMVTLRNASSADTTQITYFVIEKH